MVWLVLLQECRHRGNLLAGVPVTGSRGCLCLLGPISGRRAPFLEDVEEVHRDRLRRSVARNEGALSSRKHLIVPEPPVTTERSNGRAIGSESRTLAERVCPREEVSPTS